MTTGPETDTGYDRLTVAREIAARAQRRVDRAEKNTANADDLVLVLTAIAEELRTANLLTAAGVAAQYKNTFQSVADLFAEAMSRVSLTPDPDSHTNGHPSS